MADIQKQTNTVYSVKSEKITRDMARNFLLEALGRKEGDLSDEELIMQVLDAIEGANHRFSENTLEYASHAFHLAKEINFVRGIAYAGINLGRLCLSKGDFEVSKEYFNLALDHNHSLKDDDYEASIYTGIGGVYLRTGFLKEALIHCSKALNIYRKLKNEKACAKNYINIGVIHRERGDHGAALSYFQKALYIAKNNENYNAVSSIYLNIGAVYGMQKDDESALEYFKKILEIPEKKVSNIVLANAHIGIGQIYLKLKDEERALTHIYKGLEVRKKMDDKVGMAFTYTEIGKIMEARQEYEAAVVNYEQALKISREIGSLFDEARCLFYFARLNHQIQNYEIAEEQLKESCRIREELNLKSRLIENYELLAQLYYQTGQFRESCDYKDKLYELHKEISGEEKTKILAEMQARLDLQQRDLTIEKLNVKQETLLKANQELELFAGRAAHDLKEPLRMMGSFSSILQRKYSDKLDDSGQEFLQYIHDGAKRMDKLLSDMLVYAKSGADPRKSVEVNLNDILDTVKNNLQLTITEKEAIVEVDDLPMVKAVNVAMVQLFQNIIANALKFAKPDVVPEICVKSSPHDEHFYQLSISDNGIGIPESQQQKVFLIFQRAHANSNYEGTGIGLATCKKIVECLGGRIWLESTEGEGTTFFFLLPKLSIS